MARRRLDLAADGSVRSATFGPLWSFAIPAIPAPLLTALTPDPTPQRRPIFTWQAVPGAAYRIEIASDPSYASTLVAAEIAGTSFTPAVDLPEGSLRWRVRAIDSQGLPGAFSAADDFVLDVPQSGADFFTLTPCRVLDTRNAASPFGGPALSGGHPRSFDVAGRCGIPATATAVAANVTVVSPTAGGFLKAYPGGIPSPNTSVINFSTGIVRANNAILLLQPNGLGTLILEAGIPATATVHVLLDVVGYFE